MGSLDKGRGLLPKPDTSHSSSPDNVAGEELSPLEETVTVMNAEMAAPTEPMIHQPEAGDPNPPADQSSLELGESPSDTEQDSLAQSPDLSPVDDPLRLYLREMGNVGLLNREGEIRLAKTIEEARQELSSAVFGMPMTVISVLSLREQLLQQELRAADLVVTREAVEEEGLEEDMLAPDDEELREQTLKELDKIDKIAKPFLTGMAKRRRTGRESAGAQGKS